MRIKINNKTFTREDIIEKHRRLWNAIAEETLEHKRPVYKSEAAWNLGELWDLKACYNECYACEYAVQARKRAGKTNENKCKWCIFQWPNKKNGTSCCMTVMKTGLLNKWDNTNNYEKKARFARKIADVPTKTD